MKRVLCKFTVSKVEDNGVQRKSYYLAPFGPKPGSEALEGPVCHVQMSAYCPTDPDDPNYPFFQATPSASLQFWSVMNFKPRVGEVVNVWLEYEGESLPETSS